jgi:hypothetical protein
MTYRGVYRDGVIVPGDALDLPEGSRFTFSIHGKADGPAPKTKKKVRTKSRKKTPSQMTPEERVALFMKGFGISRDVPEWQGRSTQDIARELRTKAMGKWGRRGSARRG